ncbi:MAG TPA: hypothetical protein VMN82_08130 [Thermoanaerobaculia bacterium]|nr:hypothetical protein [Thermoanaerobaculia bacterium]
MDAAARDDVEVRVQAPRQDLQALGRDAHRFEALGELIDRARPEEPAASRAEALFDARVPDDRHGGEGGEEGRQRGGKGSTRPELDGEQHRRGEGERQRADEVVADDVQARGREQQGRGDRRRAEEPAPARDDFVRSGDGQGRGDEGQNEQGASEGELPRRQRWAAPDGPLFFAGDQDVRESPQALEAEPERPGTPGLANELQGRQPGRRFVREERERAEQAAGGEGEGVAARRKGAPPEREEAAGREGRQQPDDVQAGPGADAGGDAEQKRGGRRAAPEVAQERQRNEPEARHADGGAAVVEDGEVEVRRIHGEQRARRQPGGRMNAPGEQRDQTENPDGAEKNPREARRVGADAEEREERQRHDVLHGADVRHDHDRPAAAVLSGPGRAVVVQWCGRVAAHHVDVGLDEDRLVHVIPDVRRDEAGGEDDVEDDRNGQPRGREPRWDVGRSTGRRGFPHRVRVVD